MNKKLLLAMAVSAAVAQTIDAALITVLPGSFVSSVVRNGGTFTDTDPLLLANTSGGTGISAGSNSANSGWSLTDNGSAAQLLIESGLHLGNAAINVENLAELRFTLNQPATFSIAGNVSWQPNDFFVETVDQWVGLRDGLPPSTTYIWREGDFLRSNLQNSLSLNNVNESRGTNGDLSPFEANYGVVARVDPNSFLLAPGDYQIRWNNKVAEGGVKGLGTPTTSDFSAGGFFRFTLEAERQVVPETSGTVMLLGAGLVGLALAGRRFANAM